MQLLNFGVADLGKQTNYMKWFVCSGSFGVWKKVSKEGFSRRLEDT